MKDLFSAFLGLFYPELCTICQSALVDGEKYICLNCFCQLPKTDFYLYEKNAASERIKGLIPYQKAGAFLYYSKKGMVKRLISRLKYKYDIRFCQWMGNFMGTEISGFSGFFEDIDMLVPVPLHPSRKKKRGYNQTEELCKGINQATSIPIANHILYKKKKNTTQTTKGKFERWKNTVNMYEVRYPEEVTNKHILLVDDVLTTGATLENAAKAILQINDTVRISIFTMAVTE